MMQNSTELNMVILSGRGEDDSYVANRLLELIRKYKAPANIHLKNSKVTDVRIITEDSAAEESCKAIENAHWMIIVCSPELKQSDRCNSLIQLFLQQHKHENMLAVLAKGEPDESFPEALFYRDKIVIEADGTETVQKEKIEPLAANFRGATKKEKETNIRAEFLKIMAPIFGVNFDDLKQRHRERRRKRIMLLLTASLSFLLVLGAFSIFSYFEMQQQKRDIESQIAEINENLAVRLSKMALEHVKDNDTVGAVELVCASLTEYNGVEMPFTLDAYRAAFEAYNPYVVSIDYFSDASLRVEGKILQTWVDDKSSTAIIYDASGTLTIWAADNNRLIGTYDDANIKLYEAYEERDIVGSAVLTESDIFVYTSDTAVEFVDIHSGEKVGQIENLSPEALYCSHNLVLALSDGKLYSIDSESKKVTGPVCELKGELDNNRIVLYNNYVIYLVKRAKNYELVVYDIVTQKGKTFSYQQEEFDSDILYLSDVAILEMGSSKLEIGIFVNGYHKGENGNATFVRSGVSVLEYNGNKKMYERWGTLFYQKAVDAEVIIDEDTALLWLATTNEVYLCDMLDWNYAVEYNVGGEVLVSNGPDCNGVTSTGAVFTVYASGDKLIATTDENNIRFHDVEMDGILSRVNTYNFLMVQKNGNMVYSYLADLIEAETVYHPDLSNTPETMQLIHDDAYEYAKNHQFDSPHLVDAIIFDADEKYAIVSYKTGSAHCYATKSNEFIDSWQLKDVVKYRNGQEWYAENGQESVCSAMQSSIVKYWGKDRYGYEYFRGMRYGYILNEDGYFVACLSGLFCVDEEANQLGFAYVDNIYDDDSVSVVNMVNILSPEEIIAVEQKKLRDMK